MEGLFDNFFDENRFLKSEDLYCEVTVNGRRTYYRRDNNKVVNKKQISENIISEIEVIDPSVKMKISLLEQKCNLKKKMADIQIALDTVELKLNHLNVPDSVILDYTERKKLAVTRNKMREEEHKRKLEDLISNRKEKKQKVQKSNEEFFLEQHGIKSKHDWKKWLLENHPDKNKNMNQDICAKMIECAKKMNWN